MSYNFQTSIIGVSRQVKAEAEHIFHKDNLFVLVTCNIELGPEFRELIKPFVIAKHEVARSFKHHAMTLDLEFSQSAPDWGSVSQKRPLDAFMMAGENIPWLARTLSSIGYLWYNDRPLLQSCFLSISVLGPFDGATTSENGTTYLDHQMLRELLDSLHHLRGIQKACLDAPVSTEYRHEIEESIQRPQLGIWTSADMASTFIRTGDEAFRCGCHLQAIYAYQEALDCLHPFYRLSKSRIIAEETAIELFVKLFNRQRAARIRLEIKRKTLELTRFAHPGANMLEKSARAGIVYAVNHFSNSHSFNMSSILDWRTRLRLDVQLDLIDDFESEACMKKALRALRASMKDDIDKFSVNQIIYGPWYGWILEI